MDIRTERLGRVLADYSVNVQPGQRVGILAYPSATPLVQAVYERILERGGHPIPLGLFPELKEIFLLKGNDEQLSFVDPFLAMMYGEFDALINIISESNTRELSAVDPARQKLRNRAMVEVKQRYMDRGATGELKWNIVQFPTEAYAQESDMSLRAYEDFVYSACYCDQDDPVAEWQRIHDEQEQAIQWLTGKRDVKISGPNAEVTLSIDGRTFLNSDGHHNMPSGEIYTGPVEESVNGWVRFTYPAITSGREVEGIELWFEQGKVVKATAKKGEEYLLQMLDTDEGARYLGEFAIGTNYGIKRFTKNILFDEKIGGSFHMAVGGGYPDTGSKNRSAIHWDMICDMRDGGEIVVDGEVLYRNGNFLI